MSSAMATLTQQLRLAYNGGGGSWRCFCSNPPSFYRYRSLPVLFFNAAWVVAGIIFLVFICYCSYGRTEAFAYTFWTLFRYQHSCDTLKIPHCSIIMKANHWLKFKVIWTLHMSYKIRKKKKKNNNNNKHMKKPITILIFSFH